MNRSALAFLVVVAGVASMGCRKHPRLQVDRSEHRAGEEVVVHIEGDLSGRAYDQYWVTFQRADASEADVSGRVVLERRDREVRFRTMVPGDYEVRLHDRYPKTEHHLIGRVPVRVDGYLVKTGEPVEPGRK